MIRIRVDWHSQCPGCGTELAVDFFDDLPECAICPWCGYLYDIDRCTDHDETREFLRKAARELEDKVNAKTPV